MSLADLPPMLGAGDVVKQPPRFGVERSISLPSPTASKASSPDSDFSPAAEHQPQHSYIPLMLIYVRPFKRPGEDRFHFIEINLDTRNYKDEGIQ